MSKCAHLKVYLKVLSLKKDMYLNYMLYYSYVKVVNHLIIVIPDKRTQF